MQLSNYRVAFVLALHIYSKMFENTRSVTFLTVVTALTVLIVAIVSLLIRALFTLLTVRTLTIAVRRIIHFFVARLIFPVFRRRYIHAGNSNPRSFRLFSFFHC